MGRAGPGVALGAGCDFGGAHGIYFWGEQMGFISVLPVFGVGFGVPTAYLGFCQLGQRLL